LELTGEGQTISETPISNPSSKWSEIPSTFETTGEGQTTRETPISNPNSTCSGSEHLKPELETLIYSKCSGSEHLEIQSARVPTTCKFKVFGTRALGIPNHLEIQSSRVPNTWNMAPAKKCSGSDQLMQTNNPNPHPTSRRTTTTARVGGSIQKGVLVAESTQLAKAHL
jgi:hypothetical protein